MRKGTGRCSRQRDPQEEAEMWKHGLGWHACYRGACAEMKPGRWTGPEAARLCTPWRVDLALELTETDWGLCHEATRLEEVRLEVRGPAGSLAGGRRGKEA